MSSRPVLAQRLLAHWCVLAGCVAAMAGVAQASSVQVEVLDTAGKPLADAIVFLESADARRLTKPLPGVEMAQEKRQFVPSVMVVPVGSEVLFPNRDTVRHHVYSFSPTKKFELKLYTGTPSKPVLFDQAGVVLLGCNIHDQMIGWILVVDTPYFAKSPSGTGKALLDNVAPGAYKLRTWHARLPVGAAALEQAITVPATGMATASVRMAGLQP
ncbi:methylamine utilization protein [Acidovorax sp. A1169]|jgi:plastocyanin|uniref:methylamine utilization protein n=1 Tax=Acidovorax sp. A1169 TaxID=3059524 RepID=UPI002737924B|nr:methylamine utilization protein [Acidovorax sp. A1169]MDP4074847.1 methylamine utilization protein [Acidovorax sp. A1169]